MLDDNTKYKMAIKNLLIATSAILLLACSSVNTPDVVAEQYRGEAYSNARIATYAIPDGYPEEFDAAFAVAIGGHYTAVYNDKNHWDGSINFCNFDIAEGGRHRVKITYIKPITEFEILPASSDIKARQTSPYTLELKISKPDTYLTIIINGNYNGDALHLFANAMDNEPLCEGYSFDAESKTHRFGAGYYHLDEWDGVFTLKDNEQMYIAGGAVLDGQVRIVKGRGSRIYGRGIVMNRDEQGRRTNRIVVETLSTTDGTIEGITIFGRRAPGWVCTISNSHRCKYRNVKIISTRYASTDGLDVNICSDLLCQNMFIRSCDDAVAIKGLGSKKPADCKPNKNLTFERMQLWNDCNNAFGMGAETHASAYENITLRQSHILYSYDDPNHHETLDERSAMNICSLQGTYFRNILFEDIVVNRCERLIGLCFKDSFWFGSLPGDQSTEGSMDGITFRNISSPNSSGSKIANQIRMEAWDKSEPIKPIRNITFDNVTIGGKPLRSTEESYFSINHNSTPCIENIHFLEQ